MRFVVYTPDRANYHEISHAISISASRHYNGIGKITVTAPTDAYSVATLVHDGLILDLSNGETYIIVDVKYDSRQDTLTANGYTANALLNRRVIKDSATFTNVEAGVLAACSANLRGLPRISIASPSGLTEEGEEVSLSGGQLLDGIIPILDKAEMGHRMVWNIDTRTHTFELYKGRDLTSGVHAVTFSEEQGTAADLVITDDSSTFANYIYLPYEDANGEPQVYEYGSATGGDRVEYWVTSGETQNGDETAAEYQSRLKTVCESAAAERIRRTSFSVTVDGSELGVAYDLGDKVSCASMRFGVSFTTRITGAKYALDNRGEKTTLILGEPELTALEEVKLDGKY